MMQESVAEEKLRSFPTLFRLGLDSRHRALRNLECSLG